MTSLIEQEERQTVLCLPHSSTYNFSNIQLFSYFQNDYFCSNSQNPIVLNELLYYVVQFCINTVVAYLQIDTQITLYSYIQAAIVRLVGAPWQTCHVAVDFFAWQHLKLIMPSGPHFYYAYLLFLTIDWHAPLAMSISILLK